MANAILNVMRLNAARLNAYQPHVYLTIGGTRRETVTLLGSCRITKGRGPDGSHAILRVKTITPTVGQAVVIGIGSLNNRIFGGVVQAVQQPKNETISTVLNDLTCVGFRWLLNRRVVVKTYENMTVDALVRSLIATHAIGVTTGNVQSGMPTLGKVVFDGETAGEALDKLKQYVTDFDWYVDDYSDLHAFIGTESLVQPATVGVANTDRDFGFFKNVDLSQVRTRVYVVGPSTSVIGDASPGETTLAVQNGALFDAGGGLARVSGQLLTYTGVAEGAIPVLAAPSVARGYLSPSLVTTGITINTVSSVTTVSHTAHGFATGQQIVITQSSTSGGSPTLYTFRWAITVVNANSYTISGIGGNSTATNMIVRPATLVTATATIGVATATATAHGFATGMVLRGFYARNGSNATLASYEALLGPITVVDANTFTFGMSGYPADVTLAMIPATPGSLVGAYSYKVTDSLAAVESGASVASGSITVEPVMNLPGSYSYASVAGSNLFLGNSYSWGFSAVTADGETAVQLGTTIVASGSATSSASLSNLPITNDLRTIARNVWRTPLGATQDAAHMKYVGTINDDTTTTFSDTVTDANLGGPAPLANTAGGAVALTGIAVSANDRSAGRYVYRTAAGGSDYRRVATVSDNTQTTLADAAPDATQAAGVPVPDVTAVVLTGIPASGVGAIASSIGDGDAINFVVQRDDLAAQTALAAVEGGGSDGVREHWLETGSLSLLADLQAAGDADLNRYSTGLTDLSFGSRDDHFVPGAVAPVSLPAPNAASGSFLVQEVVIQSLELTMAVRPLREITAADVRFTLTDLLRKVS